LVGSEKNTYGDEMSTPACKEKKQESLSGKTQAIAVGLVLAIIGSLICSSYAKDTLTNYTGFGMLLTGIAVFVLGIFATLATTLKMRSQAASAQLKVRRPQVLFVSVWSVGIGVVLTVIGFMLSSTYAEYTVMNAAGYGMLLAGACIFLVGISGTMFTTVKLHRVKVPEAQVAVKVKKPKAQFYGRLLISIGIVVTVVGSLVAGSYAKETMMNYAGFGMLLVGIAVLSVGISQTVVLVLKNRWHLIEKGAGEPRVMLGSIWAIGIGAMLVINGSLIASSYAKSTLMNYAGFGLLLAGTGVFVYGMFQTARISATSAMGYLTGKRAHPEIYDTQEKEKISERLRSLGTNLVKTSAILNLAGVMFAMGLLFFSLWQLDLIVSGPVWWEASAGGQGWNWPGPGAYANDYFQCFLWKTTVGQAYDTLFLMIFISFIVLFASAFFWPRWRIKNESEAAKTS
jgi:hypothetical protein